MYINLLILFPLICYIISGALDFLANNSTIYESGLIYTFDWVILMTFPEITPKVIKLFKVFEEFNGIINDTRIAISELPKRRILKL